MQILPTRQELIKTNRSLGVARKGHKLLKDKRDSLMREFMQAVREAIALREKLLLNYTETVALYLKSGIANDPKYLQLIAGQTGKKAELRTTFKTTLGVSLPKISYTITGKLGAYSMIATDSHFDQYIASGESLLPQIVELLAVEHKARLLAQEIELTRRRVNALEHNLIPELESTAKVIAAKLEETALQEKVRVMKVKAMISAQ